MVPIWCRSLVCEYSFRDFNNIFKNGVPPEVAKAVTTSRLESRDPGQLYDMDVSELGESMKSHFEKDWMGIGGEAWFGPAAGDLLYETFVNAIKSAGSRQVKALWIESSTVQTQTLEDERLVLVLVGSPSPPGRTNHMEPCGITRVVST